MSIISVNNVTYSYKTEDGAFRGLSKFSLDVEEGEFLVLLGHNGSGKSTLAKLLSCFLMPDEGEVFINGINTKQEDKIYDIRSQVGMVFQNPDNQLVASIIEDDIAFGCENLGIPREEIAKRIEFALDAVDMTEYRDRTPFKLSGGQKQRVAIASILAMSPKILILDEATAMLDPKGRKKILSIVHKLNQEHKMTVILITHYMEEAIAASRVVVLNNGEKILDGKPSQVFKEKELITLAKLDLPIPTKLAFLLLERGVDVGVPLTTEELVEAICLSK